MTSWGQPPRRRVAVLLNHSQDPASWRERHRLGETMDATPYGYEYGERWFDMSWALSHTESKRARALRIQLAGRLGFDLIHVWRNRHTLFTADAVWTHTEREHMAVALWQRLVPRFRRPKLLAQTIWLWDNWSSMSPPRRAFYRWLLRAETVEATHSGVNLSTSRTAVAGRRVILVPFGTRTLSDDGPPSGSGGDRWDVVAPGNDEHRDWSTLAEASRMLPDVRVWVASSTPAARRESWPANVRCERVGNAREYAHLLARSRVCVVPLRPNQHASGMTTCIEASSVGTPLVIGGDGGLREIIGQGPTYVNAGDPAALAAAITEALNRQACGVVPQVPDIEARGLSQRDYVTRYALITYMMCGDLEWSDTPSALIPQAVPEPDQRPDHRA